MSSNNSAKSEERKKILSLVEEGTISADEAVEMINAVDEAEKKEQPAEQALSCRTDGLQWIHIKVIDDDDKVNVRLPLGLIRVASSFIPYEAQKQMEEQGVNLTDLMRMVEEGGPGNLIEIEESGGAHVEISVE